MNDELIRIAKKIIFNEEIRELIQNPGLIPQPNQDGLYLYKGLVDFQIEQCKTRGSSIEKEGFQIGEPWNGDIENALIIFLSSNPAFKFDEVSPRLDIASGDIFEPEHIDVTTKNTITDRKISCFKEIEDFFKSRIIKSHANNSNDELLRIPLKNGKTHDVRYWKKIRVRTEYLLPDELKIFWENKVQTKAKYVRKIMEYVVCMEIVPFKSTGEEGLTKVGNTNFTKNLFDHCWKSFTSKILELSGASIFILVGSKALKTFIRNLNLHPSIESNLRTGKPFELILGKRNRTIVYTPYNQGTMPLLPDCLPSETIKQLRDTLARRIIFDNKIASGDF